MNLQEAYAAIDAVAQPNQAVFISTQCRWHDRGVSEPRELTIEFQVSPATINAAENIVAEATATAESLQLSDEDVPF